MSVYLSEDDLIKFIKEYDSWEDYEWSRSDVIDYVIHDDSIRKIEVDDGTKSN